MNKIIKLIVIPLFFVFLSSKNLGAYQDMSLSKDYNYNPSELMESSSLIKVSQTYDLINSDVTISTLADFNNNSFYVVNNVEGNEAIYELRDYYNGSSIYYVNKDLIRLDYEYMELAFDNPEHYVKLIYISNGRQLKIPQSEIQVMNLTGTYVCLKYNYNGKTKYKICSFTNLNDSSTFTKITELNSNQLLIHRGQYLNIEFEFDGSDTVAYLIYIKDGYILNINDIQTYYKAILEDRKSLLIGEEIFTRNYDLNNYNEKVELKDYSQFVNYPGKTGKVVINRNSNGVYVYNLYSSDNETYLQLKLNGFLSNYYLEDLRFASFLFVENDLGDVNLYFEYIFDDGKDIVYNLNSGKTGEKSSIEITSKDVGYVHANNIYEYYLYFNSSVLVDNWLSMEYDYTYHKEQSYLFNIASFNYATTTGKYEVTSDGLALEDISNIDRFISKYIFKYDSQLRNNFGLEGYTVNNTFYSYRMKFLVVGDSLDKLISLSNGGIINLWINKTDGYVVIDDISPIVVDYIKDGNTYNNIVVEDNVIINPGTNPVPDPIDEGTKTKYSFKTFFKGLINSIKSNNILEFISNKIPELLITIIILILLFIIIWSLIKLLIKKIKREFDN